MTMGQFMTALTGFPLRSGGVKRAPDATRRAEATSSGWVEDTTFRMRTAPDGEIEILNTTVPRLTPLRASDEGKVAEPCLITRGILSSSPEVYWDFVIGGALGRTGLVWVGFRVGIGGVGRGAGARSAKKISTGVVMSNGISARGMGTLVRSGSAVTSMSAGGGGGVSGISSRGGGGGGSKVAVSTLRMVRSGIVVVTVNSRATPSTARSMAEAAMPMMVDLRFKSQGSTFNGEAGVVGKGFNAKSRRPRSRAKGE